MKSHCTKFEFESRGDVFLFIAVFQRKLIWFQIKKIEYIMWKHKQFDSRDHENVLNVKKKNLKVRRQ